MGHFAGEEILHDWIYSSLYPLTFQYLEIYWHLQLNKDADKQNGYK